MAMILDRFRLDGKVALVTGGSRGLGQGMALGLAEAGADVFLADISAATGTQAMIRAMGRRCEVIPVDLSERTAGHETVHACKERMGRIDILVNNAGIIRRTPVLEFTEKDWDDVIQVNLKAVFFLSQAAARVMVKQHSGKIISIASMLSFQGGIRIPSYTAAKSGVAGITRLL